MVIGVSLICVVFISKNRLAKTIYNSNNGYTSLTTTEDVVFDVEDENSLAYKKNIRNANIDEFLRK